MKFFERMKIWGKAKSEKAFKVSELDKAKQMQEDYTKQLVDLKTAYNQSRAEKDATLKQVKQYEEAIAKCNAKFNQFVAEDDKAKAQIVFEKKKSIDLSLKSLQATLEVQDTAINSLKKQKDICERNLIKVQNTMNAIKVKERYAENVSKYKDILDKAKVNGINMEDIEFNVDVKFNTADYQMKELEESQAAEDILNDVNDTDFEAAFNAAKNPTIELSKEEDIDNL